MKRNNCYITYTIKHISHTSSSYFIIPWLFWLDTFSTPSIEYQKQSYLSFKARNVQKIAYFGAPQVLILFLLKVIHLHRATNIPHTNFYGRRKDFRTLIGEDLCHMIGPFWPILPPRACFSPFSDQVTSPWTRLTLPNRASKTWSR